MAFAWRHWLVGQVGPMVGFVILVKHVVLAVGPEVGQPRAANLVHRRARADSRANSAIAGKRALPAPGTSTGAPNRVLDPPALSDRRALDQHHINNALAVTNALSSKFSETRSISLQMADSDGPFPLCGRHNQPTHLLYSPEEHTSFG